MGAVTESILIQLKAEDSSMQRSMKENAKLVDNFIKSNKGLSVTMDKMTNSAEAFAFAQSRMTKGVGALNSTKTAMDGLAKSVQVVDKYQIDAALKAKQLADEEARLAAEARKASRSFAGLRGALSGLTSGLGSSLGMYAKSLISLYSIRKAFELAGKAVTSYADRIETLNIVNTTFGDTAETIVNMSKDSAYAFGLSENAALRYAGKIGATAKSTGLAEDKVMTLAKGVVGLTSDMSSFFNMPFEAVFQKLNSGLNGNIRPMRDLGIDISVMTMQAYMMGKGMSGLFKDLSQGEKVWLRYQKIVEDAAFYHGDFIKTQNSLANALRQTQSYIQDLATYMGGLYYNANVATVAVTRNLVQAFWLGTKSGEAYDNVYNRLSESQKTLYDSTEKFTEGLKGLFKALTGINAKVAEAQYTEVIFNQEVDNSTIALSNFIDKITSVITSISSVINSYNEWRGGLTGVGAAIMNVVDTGLNAMLQAILAIIVVVPILTLSLGALNSVLSPVGSTIKIVIAALELMKRVTLENVTAQDLLTIASNSLKKVWGIFLIVLQVIIAIFTTLYFTNDKFKTSVDELFKSLLPLIQIVGGALTTVFKSITPIIETVMNAITSFFSSPGEAGGGVLVSIVETLKNVFLSLQPVLTTIVTAIGNVFTTLAPVLETLISNIVSVFVPIIEQLVPIINELLTLLGNTLIQLMPAFQSIGDSIMMLVEALMPILPMLADAFSQIVTALAPLLPLVMQIFSDLLASLLPLITELLMLVVDVITSVFDVLAPILPLVIQIFSDVLATVLPIILDIFTMLMPILTEILKVFMKIFVEVLSKVLPIVVQLIQRLLAIFMQILPIIIQIFVKILSVLLPVIVTLVELFAKMLEKLVPILIPIIEFFVKLIGVVLELTVWIIEHLVVAITTMAEKFTNFITTTIDKWTNLVDSIREKVEAIKTFFTGLVDNAREKFETIRTTILEKWDSIKLGIQEKIDAIVEYIKSIPDRIADTLANIGDSISEAFSGLFEGFEMMKGGDFGTMFLNQMKINPYNQMMPAGDVHYNFNVKVNKLDSANISRLTQSSQNVSNFGKGDLH